MCIDERIRVQDAGSETQLDSWGLCIHSQCSTAGSRTLISFWMTVRKKLVTAAGSAMAASAEMAPSKGSRASGALVR